MVGDLEKAQVLGFGMLILKRVMMISSDLFCSEEIPLHVFFFCSVYYSLYTIDLAISS